MLGLIAELRLQIQGCTACTIRQDALLPVPFDGDTNSKLMIVGRNPGRDENVTGRPFVGRGGRCLDHMLDLAGIDRARVLITNAAKCYSTNDRPPTDIEYRTCMNHHLWTEITCFQPKLIVALGNDAFRYLAGGASVIKQRQQVFTLLGNGRFPDCAVVGILHPGSALRSANYWTMMEEDFKWLVTTSQFQSAYNTNL